MKFRPIELLLVLCFHSLSISYIIKLLFSLSVSLSLIKYLLTPHSSLPSSALVCSTSPFQALACSQSLLKLQCRLSLIQSSPVVHLFVTKGSYAPFITPSLSLSIICRPSLFGFLPPKDKLYLSHARFFFNEYFLLVMTMSSFIYTFFFIYMKSILTLNMIVGE